MIIVSETKTLNSLKSIVPFLSVSRRLNSLSIAVFVGEDTPSPWATFHMHNSSSFLSIVPFPFLYAAVRTSFALGSKVTVWVIGLLAELFDGRPLLHFYFIFYCFFYMRNILDN